MVSFEVAWAFAVSVIVLGVTDNEGPPEGWDWVVRPTVPLNALMLFKVRVALAEDPAPRLNSDGVPAREKSTTATLIGAQRVYAPLVAFSPTMKLPVLLAVAVTAGVVETVPPEARRCLFDTNERDGPPPRGIAL